MTITTRVLMVAAYAGIGAVAILGHVRHGDLARAASPPPPLICLQTLKTVSQGI